jgi:alkylation response protein AidB-like acyl-CoA dehydrogenase
MDLNLSEEHRMLRGVSAELPLEHWARYLRPVRVNEGATEVLRWRLARNLLRGSRPGSA